MGFLNVFVLSFTMYVLGSMHLTDGHTSCSRTSGLMKSIQYQLKLVEEGNGRCDCSHRYNRKQIGFLVGLKTTLQNRPKGSVVIYDKVITNDGNGYNPSTGIFTASVEGLYSFSWTTTTQANKYFYTYLAVNGNLIARNHAGHDNVNLSASQTVVVHLKKNDKVNIKVQDNLVGQVIYYDGWSTFSGFMI
ncbi:complement C1q-like protein 2 [Mytilus edulis]|uniref:complement C1q-like protein 2 n=1 Tax=Mytilus edulis TaxID=6550 RepID=UPI0039F0426F